MSEIIKCKRCGRPLTNSISIELGYGKKCYRIIQLEQEAHTEEIKSDLINEISFLKMEINFLKRQFNELKSAKVVNYEDSIERIKQIKKQPDTKERSNFTIIINEMKMIFRGEQFDYHEILQPIEPRTQIVNSPILEEISITN